MFNSYEFDTMKHGNQKQYVVKKYHIIKKIHILV